MKITSTLTDQATLSELGRRLAHRRVGMSLTQAGAAEQAGVSKRTLERIENGDPVQTPNLVRVLRVLGVLEALDSLLPEAEAGPMDVLRGRSAPRRRAPRGGGRRGRDPKGWTWGEGP
jgi:transcriptional regulator with XRE-family HTH domain